MTKKTTLRKKIINGSTRTLKEKAFNQKAAAKNAKNHSRRRQMEQELPFKISYGRRDALIDKLVEAKRIRDKLVELASLQSFSQ